MAVTTSREPDNPPPKPSPEREGGTRAVSWGIGAQNGANRTLVNAWSAEESGERQRQGPDPRPPVGSRLKPGAGSARRTPGISLRPTPRPGMVAGRGGAEDADLVLLVIDAAAKLGQRAETIWKDQGFHPAADDRPQQVDSAARRICSACGIMSNADPRNFWSRTTGDGVSRTLSARRRAMPKPRGTSPADQLSDATRGWSPPSSPRTDIQQLTPTLPILRPVPQKRKDR